jgi:hypothetical protein
MQTNERPRFYLVRGLLGASLIVPIKLLDALLWVVRLLIGVLSVVGLGLSIMKRDLYLLAAWLLGIDLTPCGTCEGCRQAEAARRREDI